MRKLRQRLFKKVDFEWKGTNRAEDGYVVEGTFICLQPKILGWEDIEHKGHDRQYWMTSSLGGGWTRDPETGATFPLK